MLVAENQRLEVDAFVRYRISDPLRFYQSVFDVKGADAQLGGMLNSALRRTLSEASIVDIVRDKRDALMAEIRDQVRAGAERFGVEVVDVRIKRADLPPENSEAVFRRMQAERQRLAATFRAQGSQQSQQIKADADAKVTVTIAQAQQQSDQIRGEGDGERNRIFAESYGKDPEFFAFYRSMLAYETGFKGETRAILSPKSDFFRYFSTPTPTPSSGADGGRGAGECAGGEVKCVISARRSGSFSPSRACFWPGSPRRCAGAWPKSRGRIPADFVASAWARRFSGWP